MAILKNARKTDEIHHYSLLPTEFNTRNRGKWQCEKYFPEIKYIILHVKLKLLY